MNQENNTNSFVHQNDNTINTEQTNYQDTSNSNQTNNKSGNNLEKISITLGIISLILSFFLNFLILPVANTGLILGIINKDKQKIGIVLNSISIFIVILMSAISLFHLNSIFFKSENFIFGKYNCSGTLLTDVSNRRYLVTLHLNEDNTFLYGPYDDLENNYVKGTYTYQSNFGKNNLYYTITMKGKKEDFIKNGVPAEDEDFNSRMAFSLTKTDGKKQGTIVFENSSNTYYCYEE